MSQNQNPVQRNYNEVAAGGSDNNRWEPTKNENNPNYPKQIEGYFKSFKELPGKNGSFMVAEIQLMNQDGSLGACVDVSGGKVLENKLSEIPLGSWIMIQYLGKVSGKQNTYNDWKTFVDESAIPLHQLLGVAAPVQNRSQSNQPAFQQNQAFNTTPAQQQSPFQQQTPAFQQPQAPSQQNPFGGQQQSSAPVFNQQNGFQPQAPAQQNPFGGQQTQSPSFNAQPVNTGAGNGQWSPPPANTPNFNQQPVQQQQQNPFGGGNPFQQQNDDLPF